jgi:SecD/SecF fusion protein
MPRWVLVLLVLAIGFCLLSMAAFILLPIFSQGFSPKIGTVLVYEIEDAKSSRNISQTAKQTIEVLNLRLNRGYNRLARARRIEGDRIEVGVYGNDPKTVARVEEMVKASGALEFRIVANMHKHQAEIEIAKSSPEKEIYFDSKGDWTARWIPVKEDVRLDPNVCLLRVRKLKEREINEVLIVRDPYDVTGDYLVVVHPDTDPSSGNPCISFALNSIGGQLFGELTSENRPSPTEPELKNQLGIILNGVLYSAPNIQATITDRGIISGNFTKEEIAQLVECLNSGQVFAKLRKVDERNVENK